MGIPRKQERQEASRGKLAQTSGPGLHLPSSQTQEGKGPTQPFAPPAGTGAGRGGQEGRAGAGLGFLAAEVSFRSTQDPSPTAKRRWETLAGTAGLPCATK